MPSNPTPGAPPPRTITNAVAITHPPTASRSGDSSAETEGRGTILYTLDYLRGNQKISKIFKFPHDLTIAEVVEHCKKYCGDNNFRFVWAEVTINVMAQFEEN